MTTAGATAEITVTEVDGKFQATAYVLELSNSVTRNTKEDAVRACAEELRKRPDLDRPLLIRYPFIGRTFDVPWYERPVRGATLPTPPRPIADDEHKMPEGHCQDGDDGPVAVPVDETMAGAQP